MGFERDYMINALPSGQRKDEKFDMGMLAFLIGNIAACFNIAMVLASLFVHWGFFLRMPSSSEIRDGSLNE